MPEFVAAAAVNALNLGGLYAGSIASTVVYGATYIGTVAAIAYGSSAISASLNSRDDPGSLLEIQVASDAPRQIVIGERITGGSLVGRYVTGPGNNNLIEVLALADHRVEACLSWYVGGIATLNNLTHGSRTSVPAYRSSTDRLWVTWYDGRHDQTADANLAGRTLDNQPDWTSNHRGRGVSYAIVEMQWDDDVMLSPVASQFLLRGGRFYDRRLDDTAGGIGDHRHSDPDTWEYTTNPDVVADHYQLGIVPYPDAPLYSWGIGLKAWQLPYDLFKEEADISDEQVLKKDGVTYQDRYALNAIFSASNTHREILTQIAKAKAGRVVDRGGRLALIGPQARTPVMTLYDADLIGGEQSKYSDKLSISDLYNTFEGRFPDPLQMFRPVDFPRLTDAAWKAADGGDELTESIDIEVDTDEERVQRLVWLYAMDKRRQARLTEAYGPQAIEIEDGDWFERVSTRFPDGKLFEAMRVEHTISAEKGFFVVIHSKEVDPDDVAWDADQAADLSRPPPPATEAEYVPIAAPTITVTPVSVTGGGATLPALKIELTNADDPRIRSARVILSSGVGTPIIQHTLEAGDGLANEITLTDGLAPNTTYTVTAIYEGLTLPSEYSTPENATTGATYVVPTATTSATVADGSVTLAKFAAGITPVELHATAPVTGNFVGRQYFNTTDGKSYRYGGGGWTATVAAVDVTGTLTNAQIADLAASKITGQLTNAQIADLAAIKITGTLTNSQIADLAAIKITGTLTNSQIADLAASKITGTLTNSQIADLAASKITGQLTNSQIADLAAIKITGTLTNSQIADLAAAKITGQIITTQITDNAVTTGKVNAGAITTAKIAAGAVTATEIAAGAITTAKLAAGAVTANEIAANTITASRLLITDLSNMAPDGAFSDTFGAFKSWYTNSANIARVTADALNTALGAPVIAKFTGPGTSDPTVRWDILYSNYRPMPVEPNRPYFFSVDWGVTSGFNGLLNYDLQWRDASGAHISYANVSTQNYWSAPAGSTITGTFTNRLVAPSNAATAVLRVYVDWNSDYATRNKSGTAAFTRVTMRRAANAELIVDGSIVTAKIAAGAVTATEIAAGAITTAKLAAGAITANEIAADTITGAKIAAGTIAAANIAAGTITAAQIAANTISASRLVLTDFSNMLKDAEFNEALGATGSWSIAAGSPAITASDTLVTALGGSRIVKVTGAGTSQPGVSYDYVHNSPALIPVEPGKPYLFSVQYGVTAGFNGYLYASFDWRNAAGGNVGYGATNNLDCLASPAGGTATGTFSRMADAPATAVGALVQLVCYWGADYATRNKGGSAGFARPTMRRAANAELIVDGTITAAKIAALTITANEIAAGTITGAKIAAGTITATEIAAGAITTAKLAASAVTANEIASNAITSAKINANAVTAGKIAAGAVSATEIAANAITAAKLFVGSGGAALNLDPLFADSSAWPQAGGTAGVFATVTDGVSGNTVLRNTSAGVFSWHNGLKHIPVDASKSYRLRGWLRTVSGAGCRAYIGVDTYNNVGTFVQRTYIAASNVTPPGTWTEYSGVATGAAILAIGSGIKTMKPTVLIGYPDGGGTYTAVHEVQDVRLEELVSSTLIQDGAIITAKIAAGAVTANEIAANAITATKIAAGAITAGKIAAGAIVAADIQAGTITADRIIINGLTEFTTVSTSASVTFDGSNSWTWVSLFNQTGVVVPANAKVVFDFSCLITWALTSGAGELQFRLRRDSTTIETWTDVAPLDLDSPGERRQITFASSEVDAPAAGTYTYTLQVMLEELGAIDPLCYVQEGKAYIKQFYR